MTRSFRSRETEGVFHYRRTRRFRAFERVALRKLLQLHATTELKVLASPPGNALEALRGSRKGQHSIQINDQWRICFVWRAGDASAPTPVIDRRYSSVWRAGDAYEVEIVDYP